MPATFRDVANVLADLERVQFESIKRVFRWSDDLKPHLRGSIQCYAVDNQKAQPDSALPVICAVGVNYTQNGRCSTDLFPYEEDGGSGVVRPTASTGAVVSVLAAYERNRDAWTSRTPVDPPSPMGFYGSPDATRRTGRVTKGGFLLIMTNVCPFITMTAWGEQSPHISSRLLKECETYTHLDDLHEALGESIDLWIGHSALPGTRWVWPAFSSFIQRRGIEEWLLTANISSRSHRWFDDEFRKPHNPRFPWYGPEKSD